MSDSYLLAPVPPLLQTSPLPVCNTRPWPSWGLKKNICAKDAG